MNDHNNSADRFSAIAKLVKLGREKSFVTTNDILQFFPEAEKDVEQLDKAFATLHELGIPYNDDGVQVEDSANQD